MEKVRIAILDESDRVRAFMDNGAPGALHYYSDELHLYIKGTAHTFTFTSPAYHADAQYLAVGNKLSFRWRGKDYYLNIMKAEQDERTVEVEAYSLSLELLNEYKSAYSAPRAMTFEEYLAEFDSDGVLTVGINEVSDKSITYEWTGESTLLARIFSLATVFSAEVEFLPELNGDCSLKQITMNVRREHADDYQGIGTDRRDTYLRYGRDVSGITKKSDITDLYTAIRPEGTDGLDISELDEYEYDDDGAIEYMSPKGDGCIYAVQARDRFPSNLMAANEHYIVMPWSYETENASMLYGQALAQLKKSCVPSVEYKVDGYVDSDIGDTFTIIDEEFNPPLYLSARVTEQVRSFTDPTKNETTFDNFTELTSTVDSELLDRMYELIEASRSYTCTISSDNGIVFKNQDGETTLTASVRDGVMDVTDAVTITWRKDGAELASGRSVHITAADVPAKSVYGYTAADSDGTARGTCEVTVSNVDDGYSPSVKVEKNEETGTTTITVEDKDGKSTADVYDGVSDLEVQTLLAEYIKTDEIDAVIGAFGYLTAGEIEALIGSFGYLTANEISAIIASFNFLTADSAEIGSLTSRLAAIEDAYIDQAYIDALMADYALISDLTALYAQVTELVAGYATITQLDAVSANISLLSADVSSIVSLLAGNAGVGALEAIHITTDNAVIDDAVIINALMSNAIIGTLLAGTIYTDQITIQSEDGSYNTTGATTQYYDTDGNLRLQIGKDATGNFTFVLYDENGEGVLIDSAGIKASAISDGLIVNSMVADDAAISGYKLDIESVTTYLNEYGGLQLDSSQVLINGETLSATYTTIVQDIAGIADAQGEAVKSVTRYYCLGQSCEEPPIAPGETADGWVTDWLIAEEGQYLWFCDLIEYLDGTAEWTTPTCTTDGYLMSAVSVLQTSLTVVQGAIDAKIWQSDIESMADELNGEISILSDSYAALSMSLDGIGLEVGNLQTEVGDYYSEYTADIAALSVLIDGISLSVSSISASMEELGAAAVIGETVEYYKSESPTELAGGEWSEEPPEWEDGSYIWTRTVITYGTDGAEAVTTPAVCITGNTGADGTDGTDGIGIESVTPYYAVSESSADYPEWMGGLTLSVTGGTAALYSNGTLSITGGAAAAYSDGTLDADWDMGPWTREIPDVSDTEYLWIRWLIAYTDGTEVLTEPCCLTDDSTRQQLTVLTERYSEITVALDGIGMTVAGIQTTVAENYEETLKQYSEMGLRIDSISAEVGDVYTYVDSGYTVLSEQIAGIQIDLDGIDMSVQDVESTVAENYSYFSGRISEIDMTLDSIGIGLSDTTAKVGDLMSEAATGITVEYYLSSSDTECTGGSWSEDAPERTDGMYIWTRTTVTYGVGDEVYTTTTAPVCITGNDGKDGADGADGADGKDGVDGKDGADGADGKDGVDGKDGTDGVDGTDGIGIESVTPYYAVSESSADYPAWMGGLTLSVTGGTAALYSNGTLSITGGAASAYSDGTPDSDWDMGPWTREIPDVSDTEYLWIRWLIAYTDGTEVLTEPCCLTDDSTRNIANSLQERTASLEISYEEITLGMSELTSTVGENYSELSEKYAGIIITLEGFEVGLSDAYSLIEDNYSEYVSQYSGIASTLDGISAEVSSVQKTVSDNYAEYVSQYAGIVTRLDSISLSVESVSETAEGNSSKISALELALDEFKLEASSTYATVTAVIAVSAAVSAALSESEASLYSYVDGTFATQSGLTSMQSAITQYVDASVSDLSLEVTSLGADLSGRTVHYGTCSTAAATVAKSVTCSGFTLYTGAVVTVYFTYRNTAASPTLNVASTGAKSIRAYGSAIASGSEFNWAAKSTVTFVYNGTYWYMVDNSAYAKLALTITDGVSTLSSYADRIEFASGEIVIDSGNFTLDASGNATFSGKLSAPSGDIAGWTIATNALYSGTSSMTSTTAGTYIGTAGIRQYASSSAYVDIQSGVLTAFGASLHGDIYIDQSLYLYYDSGFMGNADEAGYYPVLGTDGEFTTIGNVDSGAYFRLQGPRSSNGVQLIMYGSTAVQSVGMMGSNSSASAGLEFNCPIDFAWADSYIQDITFGTVSLGNSSHGICLSNGVLTESAQYLYSGSTVVTASSSSTEVQVFTDTWLAGRLGLSSLSNHAAVSFSNGDGSVQAARLTGAVHKNSAWYATFAEAPSSGSYRINYIIAYRA